MIFDPRLFNLPKYHNFVPPVLMEALFPVHPESANEGVVATWVPLQVVTWHDRGIVHFEGNLTQLIKWDQIDELRVVPSAKPPLYPASQVAEIFMVNNDTIRRYIREGKLEGTKIRNRWWVTATSIESLLKQKAES